MLTFSIPIPNDEVRSIVEEQAGTSAAPGYTKEAGLAVLSEDYFSQIVAQQTMKRFINASLKALPGLRAQVLSVIDGVAELSNSPSLSSTKGKKDFENLVDSISAQTGYSVETGYCFNIVRFDPFFRLAVMKWLVSNRGSRWYLSDDVFAAVMQREVGARYDGDTGTIVVDPSAQALCHSDRDLDTDSGTDFAVGIGQTHYALASGIIKDLDMQSDAKWLVYSHGYWPWHLQVLWEQHALTRWTKFYGTLIKKGPIPEWFANPNSITKYPFTRAYYWWYMKGQPSVVRGDIPTLKSSMFGKGTRSVYEVIENSGVPVRQAYDLERYRDFTQYIMLGPMVNFLVQPSLAALNAQRDESVRRVIADRVIKDEFRPQLQNSEAVLLATQLFLDSFDHLQTGPEGTMRTRSMTTAMRSEAKEVPLTFGLSFKGFSSFNAGRSFKQDTT